jgi:hypothetical protein
MTKDEAAANRWNKAVAAIKEALAQPPLPVQEPMTEVADRFAHRMALELECVLSDGAYSNKWYKSAMQVLSEYRSAMNAIHEQHSPTFMGEPKLSQPPLPVQEPVAKVVSTAPDCIWLDLGFDPQDEAEIYFQELHDVTWSQDNASGNGIEYVRADTAPPKRPWVGLTDDEHCDIWYKESLDWMEYGKAIEAALRGKNHD